MFSLRRKKVAESFGCKALSYDQNAVLQQQAARKLATYIEGQPKKILEIGCGTGFLTEIIAQKFPQAHIMATDISSAMLNVCAQKLPSYSNIEYHQMDGEEIDAEGNFDLIISNMTFQWFEQSRESIGAMQKRLHENGTILFSTPGENSFQEWRAVLEKNNFPVGLIPIEKFDGLIEKEDKKIFYDSALAFLCDLKTIGAHQPRVGYQSLNVAQMKRACADFEETQKIITWEVAYHKLQG